MSLFYWVPCQFCPDSAPGILNISKGKSSRQGKCGVLLGRAAFFFCLHIYSNGKEAISFPYLQKRKLSNTMEKTCLKIALSTFAVFKQDDSKLIAEDLTHHLVYGKCLLLSLLAK